MRTGAVILAAGAATRMGQIKQILPYRGRSLVEHAIEQAHLADFEPVVVVLGAQSQQVGKAVQRTSATSVVNRNWELGMGSSIATGVARLLEIAPEIEALIILLADQPHIVSTHLLAMKRAFQNGNAPILAANYAGTLGVPGSIPLHRVRQIASATAQCRSPARCSAATVSTCPKPPPISIHPRTLQRLLNYQPRSRSMRKSRAAWWTNSIALSICR